MYIVSFEIYCSIDNIELNLVFHCNSPVIYCNIEIVELKLVFVCFFNASSIRCISIPIRLFFLDILFLSFLVYPESSCAHCTRLRHAVLSLQLGRRRPQQCSFSVELLSLWSRWSVLEFESEWNLWMVKVEMFQYFSWHWAFKVLQLRQLCRAWRDGQTHPTPQVPRCSKFAHQVGGLHMDLGEGPVKHRWWTLMNTNTQWVTQWVSPFLFPCLSPASPSFSSQLLCISS